ncbi:hypothetical protein F5148DRAFT_6880 [Russula earlei]|uniref:Uncharacterized protein n=1 Tax=Russula earlei TaxID=71964 RepID=A0ACC0UQG5_9AGAM|nr:hypothetical protein F5148DRAFT_6880 [Russula earlei]
MTARNTIILVHRWWNPALEDQTFDRAHRRLDQKALRQYLRAHDREYRSRSVSSHCRKQARSPPLHLAATGSKYLNLGHDVRLDRNDDSDVI